jgi:hypothetical protein
MYGSGGMWGEYEPGSGGGCIGVLLLTLLWGWKGCPGNIMAFASVMARDNGECVVGMWGLKRSKEGGYKDPVTDHPTTGSGWLAGAESLVGDAAVLATGWGSDVSPSLPSSSVARVLPLERSGCLLTALSSVGKLRSQQCKPSHKVWWPSPLTIRSLASLAVCAILPSSMASLVSHGRW